MNCAPADKQMESRQHLSNGQDPSWVGQSMQRSTSAVIGSIAKLVAVLKIWGVKWFSDFVTLSVQSSPPLLVWSPSALTQTALGSVLTSFSVSRFFCFFNRRLRLGTYERSTLVVNGIVTIYARPFSWAGARSVIFATSSVDVTAALAWFSSLLFLCRCYGYLFCFLVCTCARACACLCRLRVACSSTRFFFCLTQ